MFFLSTNINLVGEQSGSEEEEIKAGGLRYLKIGRPTLLK